jgi:glutamate/tyrosine decarboxylase-like PLP-dependent enzyme
VDDRDALLRRTAELGSEFLAGLPERPVQPGVTADEMRARLSSELPDEGESPAAVIEALAREADRGLAGSAGPRYFGFVIGGSVPAALAADWLTSTWDQNAALYVMSPAAAVAEEIAGAWLLDLLGLPADASFGFTTGATTAHVTAFAAARSAVLARVGWDVDARGLTGAPPIRILVGDEIHATVPYALRVLGLGTETAVRVASDEQGRMRADALRDALRGGEGPTIVCAQVGNVNSGAFDPVDAIAEASRAAGAWLHVDGAFGIWAAASPRRRHLVAGLEKADSWTTDAHKWLNVPYDCGLAVVRDRAAHHRSMGLSASYLQTDRNGRDGYDWVPEASRRARGFTVYAALRSLGRRGVAQLVDRCCSLAERFAAGLGAEPGVRVLNDVVLNQVLVRFDDPSGDAPAGDARTRAVIAAIQRDGTMWAGGTVWQGLAALRISVSNWSTTEADVDRSIEAIVRCANSVEAAAVVG